MATISRGYTFGPTETVTAPKLHQLMDDAQVTNITDADMAPANVDGVDNAPGLRTLGSGENQSAKGNHVHGSNGYPQIPTDGIADGAVTSNKLASGLILPVTKGGTAIATYAKGDILIGNASGGLDKLEIGANGQVLMVDTTAPDNVSWQNVPVTNNTTTNAIVLPLSLTPTISEPSGLKFHVAPNEQWAFEIRLFVQAPGVAQAQLRVRVDGPTSSPVRYQMVNVNTSASSLGTIINGSIMSGNSFAVVLMVGFLAVGNAGSDVQVGVARMNAGGIAGALTLLAGSSITAFRK